MKKISVVLLLACFLFTLMNGTLSFVYCKEALILWFEKLVPSMFITMILLRMMYQLHVFDFFRYRLLARIFHIDEACMPLLFCSLLLGFPIGSQFIDEAYKRNEIEERGAKRLLYTCSLATSGFVIMTCGVVFFNSVNIGFLLYFAQLLCVFIFLLCTRHTPVIGYQIHSTPPSFMNALKNAILQSGLSLYMIGGYLMFFMSVMGVVFSIFPQNIALPLRILTEFSSGSVLLHQLSISTYYQLLCLSALIGFGGFCVHMQIFSMVSTCSINYSTFLKWRVLQGVLAPILFAILFLFF